MDEMDMSTVLKLLDELYREVDRCADSLVRAHAERLKCKRGCCDCCVDGLTVFTVEATDIVYHYGELLKVSDAHPKGACAFLDQSGGCRIYPHRPYVCRTQGLPLRWIEQAEEGGWVEMRDICPQNDAGEPIEMLSEEKCWTIGPIEERLAGLQASIDGGRLQRVSLRSLFRKKTQFDRPFH